ncbi:MAG: flagellar hook-length control protein FliK [Sedimentisphaerales bacterium]|nr:flagellar hook-length control protein FliK [Sedimentisphaerales bacterium]
MNVNIAMINAACSVHTPTVSPSPKAGTTGEGKSFSLIQEEISSEAIPTDETVPSEDTTSHNIEQPTPTQKPTEKASEKSNRKESGKMETELSLENPKKVEPEDSSPVCQTIDKVAPEQVLETETSDLIEQDGETGGEGEAIIQNSHAIPNPQAENPNPQANSQPLVAEEIVKSAQTGNVITDESQTILESVQDHTVEVKLTADNPPENIENVDNTPTFKPIETNELNIPDNVNNTEKPIIDTQTGNNQTGEIQQNEPVISDSSISLENAQKTVSSTKEQFVDGLTNDNGQAPTDETNTTTTTASPEPVQVKSPQTPSPPPLETDSNKQTPTDDSISELQVSKDKESTQTGESLSNTPDLKTLNISEAQTSTSQPETQSHSTDNNSLQEHIEQIQIQNDNPIPTQQEPLPSVGAPKAADVPMQSSPSETSADVGRQILESIQNSSSQQSGEQQITVRLNPPELGKVFIKFQEQNSELTGTLEVNKAQTRVEIEQALPQIVRDLANAGIQIRRLDVVLSEENRSGYDSLEDQSPQDSGLYEQNSTGSQTWDKDAYSNGMNDWSTNNIYYQSVSEFEETQVGEESINVLI